MAYENPTADEQQFYKTIKDRFTGTKGDGTTTSPTAMSCEATPKLVATHDCPAGSAAKKVEVYLSFRLVHWKASAESADAGGMTAREEVTSSVKDDVKKLAYKYIVMFDQAAGKQHETDKLLKWQNAALFYHEMLHLQATIGRIKDINWHGWAIACARDRPNADFIGKGVKTGDKEHETIVPAMHAYFRKVIKDHEGVTGEVVDAVAQAHAKDDAGKRPFTKRVRLPGPVAEKDPLEVRSFGDSEVDGDPDVTIKDGEATITGKLKDDKDGHITVIFDPPHVAAVVQMRIVARRHRR